MGAQPNILQWAMWLTDQVVNTCRIGGEKTAYGHYFDSEPENQGATPEMNVVRLDADEARAKIGERLREGFDGMAGLTCLQEHDGKLWLYVEAYDTRGQKSMSSHQRGAARGLHGLPGSPHRGPIPAVRPARLPKSRRQGKRRPVHEAMSPRSQPRRAGWSV